MEEIERPKTVIEILSSQKGIEHSDKNSVSFLNHCQLLNDSIDNSCLEYTQSSKIASEKSDKKKYINRLGISMSKFEPLKLATKPNRQTCITPSSKY